MKMVGKKILIVDDEEGMRHMLSIILKKEGYETTSVSNGNEALKAIENDEFDFILCDIRMPDMDGLTLLGELKKRGCNSTIIMMSAYGTIDTAIEAMKLGAYDYISKPFKSDEIILTIRKAEERERLRRENIFLKKEVEDRYKFSNIIAKSKKMLEVFETISKIASYKSTVLIIGESGTGKELIAKAIHYNSPRGNKPFVPINCGAIPENLLESELFGHVRGAFTDAVSTKKGLFEEADGGTIFLDEISDLPLSLQVKLLRVLQEEEIRRVGDTKSIKVDVRVIAASIKDLAEEVKMGRFREDLYYRLNVLSIYLPPLRERKEDIPLLVNHFIEKFNKKIGRNIKGITSDAVKILMDYEWKGNVRELENVIERAVILAEGDYITVEQLPETLMKTVREPVISVGEGEFSIKKASEALEKELIKKALQYTGGNRTRAAKLLEISHKALLYKMEEYGIK